MSFSTITAPQRADIRDASLKVASSTQPYVQSGTPPTAAELALVTPTLEGMAAALAVAGIGPTPPADTAQVKNGDGITLQNSAGVAYTTKPVAIVANSTFTAAKLPATHALIANSATAHATGTGTTATFVIKDGVVTGVTLS